MSTEMSYIWIYNLCPHMVLEHHVHWQKQTRCAFVHWSGQGHVWLRAHLSLSLRSLTNYRVDRLGEAVNVSFIDTWAIGVNLLQVIYVHVKLYAPGCSASGKSGQSRPGLRPIFIFSQSSEVAHPMFHIFSFVSTDFWKSFLSSSHVHDPSH